MQVPVLECPWNMNRLKKQLTFGMMTCKMNDLEIAPQWGALDAEVKFPSGENTEFKRFPF